MRCILKRLASDHVRKHNSAMLEEEHLENLMSLCGIKSYTVRFSKI